MLLTTLHQVRFRYRLELRKFLVVARVGRGFHDEQVAAGRFSGGLGSLRRE